MFAVALQVRSNRGCTSRKLAACVTVVAKSVKQYRRAWRVGKSNPNELEKRHLIHLKEFILPAVQFFRVWLVCAEMRKETAVLDDFGEDMRIHLAYRNFHSIMLHHVCQPRRVMSVSATQVKSTAINTYLPACLSQSSFAWQRPSPLRR